MDYQLYSPSDALAPYVKCYWSLRNEAMATSRKRIFPDGCIELIFHYGDLFRKYESDDTSHIQARSFFHGQIKKHIEIEPTGVTGVFGVRFHPGGLQRFIDLVVDSFTEKTLAIEDVWQNEGSELKDKVIDAENDAERINEIEKFLLSKFSQSKRHDNDVEYCVTKLVKTNGMLPMENVADELHIGKRQLERKFIAAVGLSPKMLSRILRFQYTLQLIEKHEFTSFTKVAYDGGFYDQAHFIRDFKEFTGLNPKQYFSEDLEMAKYFSFD